MSQVTRSNFQWHFSVENLNNVNVPTSQNPVVHCPPKALFVNQSTPQRASSIGLGRLRRCLFATSSVAVFAFVIITVTLIIASVETADNSTLNHNSRVQFDLKQVPSDRDSSDNELIMSAIAESASFKPGELILKEDEIDRSILHVIIYNENGRALEALICSHAFEEDVARLSGFVSLEVTNVVLLPSDTP